MKKTIMTVKTGLYDEWKGEEYIYFDMTLDEFMEEYKLNEPYQFFLLSTTKGDIIINKNYIINIKEVER